MDIERHFATGRVHCAVMDGEIDLVATQEHIFCVWSKGDTSTSDVNERYSFLHDCSCSAFLLMREFRNHVLHVGLPTKLGISIAR